MDDVEYIRQLEERIEKLENFIGSITVGEGKDIFLKNCPIGNVYVSEGCNMSFDNCSIGSVLPDDINDAEGRIDELEDRLQDIIFQIDEAKS
jgi:hypothetical protein